MPRLPGGSTPHLTQVMGALRGDGSWVGLPPTPPTQRLTNEVSAWTAPSFLTGSATSSPYLSVRPSAAMVLSLPMWSVFSYPMVRISLDGVYDFPKGRCASRPSLRGGRP